MKLTIGGERLGSGRKMQVDVKTFNRSTHDLGNMFKTTMSAGTLVPFLKKIVLPGDTFDIDLDSDVKTLPTVGPLFGSFKQQNDCFLVPIRLFNAAMHNNRLKVGMTIDQIKFPYMRFPIPGMSAAGLTATGVDINNMQVNPSCILAYLGIRGFGVNFSGETETRDFHAMFLLAYWEVIKNYYANKQEEYGKVIHTTLTAITDVATGLTVDGNAITQGTTGANPRNLIVNSMFLLTVPSGQNQDLDRILVTTTTNGISEVIPLSQLGTLIQQTATQYQLLYNWGRYGTRTADLWTFANSLQTPVPRITIQDFELTNIDLMRDAILAAPQNVPYNIQDLGLAPYSSIFETGTLNRASVQYSQEGLALKCYQSDLFNNWLDTEFIDGTNGANNQSRVDTSGGSFGIDQLLIATKVFDYLNAVAIAGASLDDWMSVVWTTNRYKRSETPIYIGSLIKEVIFQEVVSNTESPAGTTGAQPLGTLAGKGIMGNKHKGGRITVKADEPSILIGITSLTPRLDYSQGNDWDTHLATLDDLHKPVMDEIGFQDLIIEQMAWWTTYWNAAEQEWVQVSAGKQPAWINYMTEVNKTYGDFAIGSNSMFMTLNRQYRPNIADPLIEMDDLTAYIDPQKYNNIFAQTALDSQNFWVTIAIDITARREMSAKIMPSL